jgi:hypothetical protein
MVGVGMVRFLPKLVLAASIAGALLAVPQHPAIAAPVPAHARAAVPAPAPAGAMKSNHGISSATNPGLAQRRSCSPTAKGDYVHISSTAPQTASGHGWWLRNNCTAAKATVESVLQEYFSDGSWRSRGQGGQATVYPGGGSANWANARAVCQTKNVTGWRSVVHVYPVGESGSGSTTTAAQNIACRVP